MKTWINKSILVVFDKYLFYYWFANYLGGLGGSNYIPSQCAAVGAAGREHGGATEPRGGAKLP